MRIGLSGAPKSGKTELAVQLAEHFGWDDPYPIVDDYVEDLRADTDWAYGYWGGYQANLQVALERLRKEIKVELSSKNKITCGTLLDTCAYAANLTYIPWENEIIDARETQRTEMVMHILGMLFIDTFPERYDHLFYLPTRSEEFFDKSQDEILRMAFNQFRAPHHALVTDQTQLADAIRIIESDEASQIK